MQVIDRIGSDPEVFLVDTLGNLKSSIGRIGGSKTSPRYISVMESIQEDNVLAEFNTVPAKTADQLSQSISNCLEQIERITGLRTKISSSEIFPENELSSPQAWEFGCDPDFDGYHSVPSKLPKRTRLRTGGGHIHISFENFNESEFDHFRFARCMDEIVARELIIRGIENDIRRRKLYGRPGSFRPKPWGIEYRTLSNQWIKDEETIHLVWDLVHKAVEFYNNGGDAHEGTKDLILGLTEYHNNSVETI